MITPGPTLASLVAATADGGPGGGSSVASWNSLVVMLSAFTLIVVGLLVTGRGRSGDPLPLRFLGRIPDALQRASGIPGWAAATIGTSLFGILVAGQGFYSDVAWHVALGRDDELFTAPHTAIVVGLVMIVGAATLGIVFATLDRVDTRLRWGGLRVPWSAALLGLLGLSAVSGFPLDELWHRQYGIDVTMWSPTHMLMILGASFSGMASWLVLAEARVPVSGRRMWRAAHVLAAHLTLQGLSAALGEFAFGVPQFSQLFHPMLLCLAAGLAMVAMRLVLGRGWALGITVVGFVVDQTNLLGGRGQPVETRAAGLFIVSALAVELVALTLGTERRARFAVASGLAVGTVGLVGEWAWNTGAYQPWRAALLPEALLVGVVVAVAAALLGAAYAGALTGDSGPRLPRPALIAAGLVLVVAIAVPMRRPVGEVRADVALTPAGGGRASIEATLDPPDAADGARWFQAVNWQGGSLELSEMAEVSPGRWVSEDPVPVDGDGKTLLRLHRGAEMMAVAVHLPADPEIGEPEVPAVDRQGPFVAEGQYLLRETRPGDARLAWVIYALLTAVALSWAAGFVLVTTHVGGAPLRAPRRAPARVPSLAAR